MYITNFEITNYKSYRESGQIEFKSGFNIITGQNSAGKTALLEALTPHIVANPHRSMVTIPFVGAMPPQESSIRMTLVFSPDEFLQLPDGRYNIPRPADGLVMSTLGRFEESQQGGRTFLKWLASQREFRIFFQINKSVTSQENWFLEDPPLGIYPPHQSAADAYAANSRTFITFRIRQGQAEFIGFSNTAVNTDVSIHLAQTFRSRIYRFSAERFNVGQSGFGNNPVLASNAQNLPEVLNILQHNPARMRQFNGVISEILPQVMQISVRPIGGNLVEVTVWPHDPNTQRGDLSIPLNQCGSGIGQGASGSLLWPVKVL